MNKKIPGAISFFAGALLMFFVLGQFAFRKNDAKQNGDVAIDYTWKPPALPEAISFANEKVPLERWDVKERLDREILYNYYDQANIIYLLKLANRYFPVISQRLKENEVPDDFKYLCVAESNLVSSALSRSGAVSFWQFMDYTAPGYNLQINAQVDQRYDVEKATDAACKYLKQAYAKYGSWTAAAASYNCGQGAYSSQAAYQQTNNYYDLMLSEQTNRYLFRILAFKQLMQNAKQYGFSLQDEEKYPEVPFRTVEITQSIPDLARFAIANNTTYKMLRLMNPWLRGKSLPVKAGATYTIKLPAEQ